MRWKRALLIVAIGSAFSATPVHRRRSRLPDEVPCSRRSHSSHCSYGCTRHLVTCRAHVAPLQGRSPVPDRSRVVVAPPRERHPLVSAQPSRPTQRRAGMGAGGRRRRPPGGESDHRPSRVAADRGTARRRRKAAAQCVARDRRDRERRRPSAANFYVQSAFIPTDPFYGTFALETSASSAAHRLAGQRHRRDPRHEPARTARASGLPRVHPCRQRRREAAPAAGAARHADRHRPTLS